MGIESSKRPESITRKLLVSTALTLLVLASFVATLGHSYLSRQNINVLGKTTQAMDIRMASNINKALHNRLQDVLSKADIAGLLRAKSPALQQDLINSMQASFPAYLWIGITDTSGKVEFSSKNMLLGREVSQREWFQSGLKAPTVVDRHEALLLAKLLPPLHHGTYQFVDFSAPMRNAAGEVTGVFAVHLDWNWLQQEITNSLSAKELNRNMFVLGSDNSLRYASNEGQNFQNLLKVWKQSAELKLARSGKSGWSVMSSDGENYLVAFSPMDYLSEKNPLNWITLTVVPLSLVNTAITPSLLIALAAMSIGVVITLFIVFYFSRKISSVSARYYSALEQGQFKLADEVEFELPRELMPTASRLRELVADFTDRNARLSGALNKTQEEFWMASSLIEQAPVCLAMLDSSLCYIAASELWKESFNLADQDLSGLPMDVVKQGLPSAWLTATEVLQSGETKRALSDRWLKGNSDERWINWVIAPWIRPDGHRVGVIIMSIDVTEQRSNQIKLAASEERFNLAMQGSSDGLWDWSIPENTIYFSPTWKKMLGYEEHEIGSDFATWQSLTHPDDLGDVESHLNTLLEKPDETNFSAEFRMRHKSGAWRDILSRALIIRNSKGHAIRMVGTHIDQTEQHQMEARVAQAATEAEAERAANQAKGQFLATISHEIRTPLNGVIGFAKLLYEDLPAGESKRNAESLLETAETLTVILNDILDFSKIEAGKLMIEPAPFLVSQLLASTKVFGFSCQAKGIELRIRNFCEENEVLKGDLSRLRQVLQNLLSNAIKFTDRGHVELTLSTENLPNDRTKLVMSVEDTGVGIPQKGLEKLFKPFIQVNNERDQKLGGTGLGLSIVKALSESMNGGVRVESELGVGTRFTCEFNLEKVDPDNEQQSNESFEPARSLHVLIADDSPINLRLLKTFLERAKHTVAMAKDGQQALEMAMAEPFDFILLDVNMPMLTGHEVAQRIRAEEGPNQHCEIAAVTGFAYEDDIEQSRESGFNYHFAKPVQFDLLLNRLALSSQEITS